MSWVVQTAPEFEPITVAEVKSHCRIDDASSDSYLPTLISSTREALEHELQRALCTQTLDVALDEFPSGAIDLPVAGAASVTHVKYINSSGVLTTIDAGSYSLDAATSRIEPAYGYAWPTVRAVANAVTIRYVAGYGDGAAPASIKHRLLMMVAEAFEHREAAEIVSGNKHTFGSHLTDRYWTPGV